LKTGSLAGVDRRGHGIINDNVTTPRRAVMPACGRQDQGNFIIFSKDKEGLSDVEAEV